MVYVTDSHGPGYSMIRGNALNAPKSTVIDRKLDNIPAFFSGPYPVKVMQSSSQRHLYIPRATVCVQPL